MKRIDTTQTRDCWWFPGGVPDLINRTVHELCDALDEAYQSLDSIKAVCDLHRICHVNEILVAMGEEPRELV